MQTDERQAIARLAHEAINSKNVALLEGQPGFWQTRQIFPLLFAAYPDLSSTVEQQTVDGEWVTTRITLRGTHRGEFMGVAPTGKSFEIMRDLARPGGGRQGGGAFWGFRLVPGAGGVRRRGRAGCGFGPG